MDNCPLLFYGRGNFHKVSCLPLDSPLETLSPLSAGRGCWPQLAGFPWVLPGISIVLKGEDGGCVALWHCLPLDRSAMVPASTGSSQPWTVETSSAIFDLEVSLQFLAVANLWVVPFFPSWLFSFPSPMHPILENKFPLCQILGAVSVSVDATEVARG